MLSIAFHCICHASEVANLPKLFGSLPEGAKIYVLINSRGDSEETTLDEVQETGKLTVQIIRHTWVGDVIDFAALRNKLDSFISEDLIFWIDSEEYLIPQQNGIIARICNELHNGVGGVFATQLSYQTALTEKETTSHLPVRQCRIYRNVGDVWLYCIHEQNARRLQHDFGYRIVDSAIIILHDGYDISVTEKIKKMQRNLIGLGRLITQLQVDDMHYFNVAKMLRDTSNYLLELKENL